MTRLQAIRHLRQGGTLHMEHEGIENTFSSNVSTYAFKSGKVRCIFANIRPWGGMFDVVITPQQVLSYIRRNYPTKVAERSHSISGSGKH